MSTRIEQLIKMVRPADRLIDVGCDHGLVSLGLARRSDIGAVLATDISAPSLAKLRTALESEEEGVRKKVTTAVTDGLTGLPWDRTEAILIAGMGGDLIIRILSAKPDLVAGAGQLLLSPHSHADKVRLYLAGLGRPIRDEALVYEEGHYYEILDVGAGDGEAFFSPENYDPWTAYFGIPLLKRKDPILRDRIGWEIVQRRSVLDKWSPEAVSPEAKARRASLEREAEELQALRDKYFSAEEKGAGDPALSDTDRDGSDRIN